MSILTPPPAAPARPPSTVVASVVPVPLVLAGRAPARIEVDIITFHGLRDAKDHFAVRLGNPQRRTPPLVRVHSECVTGDVFGSQRCDCGPQLAESLRRLDEVGGYLLYLRQEGRGIGLSAKLAAYALQDEGHDTYAANRLLGRDADERDYRVAADMLRALGVTCIALLSNNPDKRRQLTAAGIEVAEQVRTGVFVVPQNRRYLEAKVRLGGHAIELSQASA